MSTLYFVMFFFREASDTRNRIRFLKGQVELAKRSRESSKKVQIKAFAHVTNVLVQGSGSRERLLYLA
jgi:hypothetical protein